MKNVMTSGGGDFWLTLYMRSQNECLHEFSLMYNSPMKADNNILNTWTWCREAWPKF